MAKRAPIPTNPPSTGNGPLPYWGPLPDADRPTVRQFITYIEWDTDDQCIRAQEYAELYTPRGNVLPQRDHGLPRAMDCYLPEEAAWRVIQAVGVLPLVQTVDIRIDNPEDQYKWCKPKDATDNPKVARFNRQNAIRTLRSLIAAGRLWHNLTS